MRLSERQRGDVRILDVAGRITIGRGDVELRQAIAAALEDGCRKLLLNLEKVAKADSAGVGELAAAYIRVTGLGGSIKLLGLSPKVSGSLQVTRLTPIFEIFDDEDEAVASFAQEARARLSA